MKKLLLGFIATLLMSVSVFGQSKSATNNINDYKKAFIVTIVQNSTVAYKNSKDFTDFIKILDNSTVLTESETVLMKDVYSYHKKGMSNIAACDVKDISSVDNYLRNINSAGKSASSNRCGFFCIIKAAAVALQSIAEAIITLIETVTVE